MHRVKVTIVEDALDANNTIASANRDDFDRHGVKVINFMSAPGAGKTTLLEQIAHGLEGVRVGVLEGDVQGSMDADRLASLHMPVTQINTDPSFGGECHLDANMVRSAIPSLPLDEIDLLVVENVGNLVCPAEFRIGEDARVMVCAVTEGEDKPLKYPLMFRTCELVIVNKIDLLPHLEFDLERLLHNIDQVHPDVDVILLSATHRRGGRGLARLAHEAGCTRASRGCCVNPIANVGVDRGSSAQIDATPRAPDGREPALLRGRVRAARASLPPDGGAIRPGRPSGRVRADPVGALGRATRGGRVRAPGDRRQASAAGDRTCGRGRRHRASGRADCSG